jgi:cysteine desulfurase
MVYLDYASGSPVDPRVVAYARQFLTDTYGNPSTLHTPGLSAKRALERAREQVAALIHAGDPRRVVFTGNATEANNIAVRGTALRNRRSGTKVALSAIEHISVVNPVKELKKQGFEVAVVPVDREGIVDLDALAGLVVPGTTLVSVTYANDEIGTIEPIGAIAEIVHEAGACLHANATAAAGRVPIDVEKEGIDLLTLSSNELSGPRGAAALYIAPGVKLQPLLAGGGQERGIRPGTENLFAIAGMGEAARLAAAGMEIESARLAEIRDRLIAGILEIDEAYLTGHRTKRLPNHASFRFSRIEGESILLNLDALYDIQVATGSACTSQTLEASATLLAIGLVHAEAHGSMVMTLGPASRMDDLPRVIDAVTRTVERLRSISPL